MEQKYLRCRQGCDGSVQSKPRYLRGAENCYRRFSQICDKGKQVKKQNMDIASEGCVF